MLQRCIRQQPLSILQFGKFFFAPISNKPYVRPTENKPLTEEERKEMYEENERRWKKFDDKYVKKYKFSSFLEEPKTYVDDTTKRWKTEYEEKTIKPTV